MGYPSRPSTLRLIFTDTLGDFCCGASLAAEYRNPFASPSSVEVAPANSQFSEIGQHANSTSHLRSLGTKEKAENFHTAKIIGKGAFSEVKLVSRKNDGKVYLPKSLLKQEVVSDIVYIRDMSRRLLREVEFKED